MKKGQKVRIINENHVGYNQEGIFIGHTRSRRGKKFLEIEVEDGIFLCQEMDVENI